MGSMIRLFKNPLGIAFAFAALKVVLYLIAGANYGYFRDELYFLACTEHLAWGYPDHAPLSIFIAWAGRGIFGDSLYAIHLLPTLGGALKIILTGLIVRELGGRHFGMLLACLCVLAAPVYLSIDMMLSMNVYEPIFWMGCVLSYIWTVKREDPRFWLLFGAFAGLGVMNKHSLIFFGAAFVIGIMATRDRRAFANGYFWLGGVLAFALFLPNLIWEYKNDWATLELLRNVQESGKNVLLSPLEFIWQQVFILLPLSAVVWLAGLWYFLADRDGKRFRTIGILYLVTLVLMIVLKAKNYYLVPVYPVLFAAGGVLWESAASRFRFGKTAIVGYAVLVFAVAALFAPIAVPLLPPEAFIAYQASLGIAPPKTEVGHSGPMPQYFGDRFGWEEMAEATAAVYDSLPEAERQKAAILTENYGQAGAIDFFGRKSGLPTAISGHQSYYLWGPRDYDGSVVVILGSKKEDVESSCDTVEERTPVGHPYAMPTEHFNILVCRGTKEPLSRLWPKLKHWN
ncbi:MAG: glycosyltransferase family 39 protein [Pyrinomonadaceae bacterium]|nr:glycosyltransferase family 39 protein [Pyrinomonadaceae bacterium]